MTRPPRIDSLSTRHAVRYCHPMLGILAAVWLGPGSASPASEAVPGSLSFDAAASRLLQVSDALAAAQANLHSKRELAAATANLRVPEVVLDVRELKFQKSLDLSLGPLAEQFGLPASFSLRDGGWRFRPNVIATLPLYTGGQIPAAQRAAAAAVEQADAEHSHEAQSQTMLLVQTYFGQQLAAQALNVRREVRDGLQQHLDNTGRLEQGGFATRAQILQATVARDQAERDHQRAIRELEAVSATLARLLRSERSIATSTPLFVVSTPVGTLESFQQAAIANHPQLSRLQAIAEQADQGVRLQQSRLRPQVFLFGQHDLHREDALFTEPDWVFGIGFRYPLISGSDRPRQVSAARGQLRQAQAGLREAENQVLIGVTRAWNQLENARQQFLLLESAISQAEENLRLQELSFREGQSTSLDVIDARLRLGGVSLELAQAAYHYDLALGQLLEISGGLDRYFSYVNQADRVITP